MITYRHYFFCSFFVAFVLLVPSSGWGVGGSVSGNNDPVLYIVSMMHAEENVPFQDVEISYNNMAEALNQLDTLFNEHNAKIDFGPDWTFIEGVLRWNPTFLTNHLALGQGIHTHAHETTPGYDLKGVNDLLLDAGLTQNIVANGGFTNSNTPPGENWIGYIANIIDDSGDQLFTSVVGYKDPVTQIPDGTGFIFRPSCTGDWKVHDPDGLLIYIGGNNPEIEHGGVLDFETIRLWINDRLANLDPDKVNTLYWHDSLHNYRNPIVANERIDRWKRELNQYFDPLVAEGKIEWKTFEEMTQIYLASEIVPPAKVLNFFPAILYGVNNRSE